jgi:hypothetical protein
VTVTGYWIKGTAKDVTESQGALDWLYETYFKPKEQPNAHPKGNGVSPSHDDQEVIDKAIAARNGGKLAALFYGGSWQSQGYPSQSEADAALCSMLAFWTQDLGQIDRIFRQSALMRRKWDEVHHSDGRTYGQATIQRTLNIVGKPYQHNRQVWREAQGNGSVDPPPWPDEDPPVEAYADDPEAQGKDRDSETHSGGLGIPYVVRNGSIHRVKGTNDGSVEIPLCNFDARIVEEVILDDGAEVTCLFGIEGSLSNGRKLPLAEVVTTAFPSLNWVTSNWGNLPVVYAGQANKDHLRCAIQLLSRDFKQRTVYGHLGWRKIDGE